MTHIQFQAGQHALFDDVQYEFVRRTGDDRIALEDVETRLQRYVTDDEIAKCVHEGRFRFVHKRDLEKFTPKIADFASLPKKHQECAEREVRYLSAIFEQTEKLSKGLVTTIASQVALNHADPRIPSYATICRWRKKHWASGGSILGHVPLFHERGRKRKIRERMADIFAETLRQYYLIEERPPQYVAYEMLVHAINEENKNALPGDRLTAPSLRTFERELHRLDKKHVMRDRYSARQAHYHYHTFTKMPPIDRPNQYWQIDDTPVDVIIVTDKTREPIGRPTLVLCVDSYSALPTGFHITFGAPSAETAMACLRNAILDKSYVRKRFPDIQHDYPVYGIPMAVGSDNHAGFRDAGFNQALAALNIDKVFGRKAESWSNPHVERTFRTIGTSLIHFLPGTTRSNPQDRGTYKSKEKATLTLSQLEHAVWLWIIDYITRKENKGRKAIPIELWKEGTDKNPVRSAQSIEQLDCLLAPAKEAKLRRDGIEAFSGLRWNSPDVTRLRRQGNVKKEISVRYDPNDLDNIYILDPDTKTFIQVPSVDPEYTRGLTTYQHRVTRKLTRKKIKGKISIADLCRTRAKIFGIVDKAAQETAVVKLVGKRAANFMGTDPETSISRPAGREHPDDVQSETVNSAAAANSNSSFGAKQYADFLNDDEDDDNTPSRIRSGIA